MTGAAVEINANVKGTEVVERRLAKMLRGVEDLEPLMDEIGGILVASTQHNFERGRAPDGTAWLPSERATNEGGQTLIDSGILLTSITHNADRDSVEVGSNMVYAGIHQFGGAAGRNGATKLPARPYLGISTGDAFEIEAAAEDYLAELAR
tara:strand:- start:5847 stop:6299 length:453 start_codon:yes stop_codon:yes gene_type:complete